jgi:hypothetical protein
MKRTLCAVGLVALCVTGVPSLAHAVTGALCISAKLNGPLKLRATGICKAGNEIQIGSFDGTTLQFSGVNVQIISGSGGTGFPNGKGNLIVGTTRTHSQGSHEPGPITSSWAEAIRTRVLVGWLLGVPMQSRLLVRQ